MAQAADWRGYLYGFHAAHAGVTERVLARATGRAGGDPYRWLVEPLRDADAPLLDLACGSAPTRALLPGVPWVGVDLSAAELALAVAGGRTPVVRGRADVLPVADGAIGAVCAAMCFQVLEPLDGVLDELRRVLRGDGRLVALVPARASWTGVLPWLHVLRALGVRTLRWPNPQALDGLGKVLRAAGFAVDADERRVFRLAVETAADAELVVDSLYLPDVDEERIAAAKQALAGWARPGRRLPLPLRRVVAHLPG
ncbi:MAG: methyltransferase domain-containing protein [Streptosporangiales bacterium]|nr:methyltransferase domain-containing protein [Streptosporangiales bacterium]